MEQADSDGDARRRAYRMVDKLTLPEAFTSDGSVDEENTLSQGNRNEPEPEPQLGESGKKTSDSINGDDSPLNIEKILIRFDEISRNRYRGGTPKYYMWWFRRFATHANLERYNRRQIAGNQGKKMILGFLSTLPKRSVKVANAAIKSVWRRGIGLPYPIETDIDLDRPPKAMPRSVPPDSIIREYMAKLNNENDPYLRALWMIKANYGWRPQHTCKMKWRNVEFDENGMPVRFIGDGARELYKNNSVIIATIFPDVADALLQLRKMPGYDSSPEKPIFPFRYIATGKFVSSEAIIANKNPRRKYPHHIRLTPTEQKPDDLRTHWESIWEKYGVQKMRMCDIRHWVSKACKDAGLTEKDQDVACALMGHDPAPGINMQNWYATKSVEEIIDLQKLRLPNGPLGTLRVDIQVTSDIPQEIAKLWLKYSNGEIGTFDLTNELESIKNRQLQKTPKMEL